ncbi:drug/metabolite transporter (DMT)-like permease [Sphingomonas sp. UYAg733]
MFGNHHFDRVREIFSDQFEPDGADFVYRKSMKGAPIRVSAAERDTFLADFRRRLRYATWGIFPATLLLIGLLVVLVPDVDSPSSNLFIYGGIGVIIAVFMVGYYWAWNAPARELERRPTLGEARSRVEVRRVMLAKMTYGQLLIGIGAMAALLFKVSDKTDLFHGWGRLWLVFAVLIVLGILFQMFRKWRFDQQRDNS